MTDGTHEMDDEHARKVVRYLAILRQLGFIAACTFSLSLILGVYLGRVSPILTIFAAVLGFFVVYVVVDRFAKTILGRQYRPADTETAPGFLKSFVEIFDVWIGFLFFAGLAALAIMALG